MAIEVSFRDLAKQHPVEGFKSTLLCAQSICNSLLRKYISEKMKSPPLCEIFDGFRAFSKAQIHQWMGIFATSKLFPTNVFPSTSFFVKVKKHLESIGLFFFRNRSYLELYHFHLPFLIWYFKIPINKLMGTRLVMILKIRLFLHFKRNSKCFLGSKIYLSLNLEIHVVNFFLVL